MESEMKTINLDMTFKEFIEHHVRVAPKGEHIKLTSTQYAFLDWLEKCKEKGLKSFYLNGRIGKI